MSISPSEFLELRENAGSREHVAKICGVTVRQVRRWETGHTPPPAMVVPLLLMLDGQLGAISPEWSGWELRKETLRSPEGETYTRTWFYQLPYIIGGIKAKKADLSRQVEELQAEIEILRAKLMPKRKPCKKPPTMRQMNEARKLDPQTRQALIDAYNKILNCDIVKGNRITDEIKEVIEAKLELVEANDNYEAMRDMDIITPLSERLW